MKQTRRGAVHTTIIRGAGLVLALGLAGLTGCVTQPTRDLTAAPFRASTDLTNGTTNATKELTGATTDFTSSTSPRSWFTQDGLLKGEHRVRALAVLGYENLKEDIAQGRGEYLAAAARLAGVPEPEQAAFFRYAQSQFDYFYAADIRPAESISRVVSGLSRPGPQPS